MCMFSPSQQRQLLCELSICTASWMSMLDIHSILEHAPGYDRLRLVGHCIRWSTRSSIRAKCISPKVIEALDFVGLQIRRVGDISSFHGRAYFLPIVLVDTVMCATTFASVCVITLQR